MKQEFIDVLSVRSARMLALTFFNAVEKLSQGKAYGASRILAAITARELAGCCCPDAAYRSLALQSVSDLARCAPETGIVLLNWPVCACHLCANSSETASEEFQAVLTWAQSHWPGAVLLEPETDS